MIKREVYTKLEKYMKKKEIIAIVGSRQVGKTTIMKQLFDEIQELKKVFISFDDHKILTLFQTNIDSFVDLYVKQNKYLFIDEFQYAKTGGQKLKYIYDKFNIKILISGSSAPDLSIQTLSYLTGRVFIFEMFPLTFKEFLSFKDEKLVKIYEKEIKKELVPFFENLLEEYLIYGGYPQVVITDNLEEKKNILKLLVNNYLLKEIRDVLSFENSFEYEKLLEILAIKNANLLNKTNIANDSGINTIKIDSMINILSKTYIISLLRPYENKKIKELIKSPKIYFEDLGFRNLLLDSFTKINLRVDKGEIFETFIFQELKKQEKNLKFYNFKNSSEVDFLVKIENELIPIEVKSNLSGLKIEKSAQSYIKLYSPKIMYVLNANEFGEIIFENTKVIFTHYLNVYSIFNN